MSKKWIVSLALAVSVSVVSACGGDTSDNEEGQASDSEQEQTNEENGEGSSSEDASNEGDTAQETEMPDPDLSDIPDVVAEVNGEEIEKSEFETVYVSTLNNYAAQGMNIQEQDENGEMQKQLQQSTVEQLVGQELLIQEAENQELSASEEEVNEQLTSLKEQFGSDEEFQNALESEGVSKKQLKSDIERQVKVTKLVENETGEIEVTDEEVEELYNQMVESQNGSSEDGDSEGGENEDVESTESETPSLEDMRPQLEQQITTQKQNEQVQSLVEELREEGDVTVNL